MSSGRRFALVGGIATSARGEPRFTRDIDLAVAVSNDQEAETLLFQLNQRGYSVLATVEQDHVERLSTARLTHPSGVICDLIFATCGVEEELINEATPIEVFDANPIYTASLEGLLAMKVLSVTPERPKDLQDIQALLVAAGGNSLERVDDLLELIQKRGYDRNQDLMAKWTELKSRFKVQI
ncbi:MAG: nucleotidyl transferase AbiEii/AbiGii toxin family protein [Polyangiaceae bacterium]|nr:nucleotidyl transferase AbiEii/AbiGii toxin family protein [Polyangiaceae bacterium]